MDPVGSGARVRVAPPISGEGTDAETGEERAGSVARATLSRQAVAAGSDSITARAAHAAA